MTEEIKVIVEKFEVFIKRSVLPSASFILFLLIFDVVFNNNRIIEYLDKSHSNITIALFILAFIGLTNLLSILQQAIYDNRLKNTFNGSSFPWKNENNNLDTLRKKVNQQLNKDENDYMLYKILGRNMSIDTTEYSTQAKTFGIMFISLIIVTIIWFHLYLHQSNDLSLALRYILFLVIITIEYYVGRELVKSRYRSRAIKIYSNFINNNKEKS
jgi:hypothetical protein